MSYFFIALFWLLSLFIVIVVLVSNISIDGKPVCRTETNWRLQTEVTLCK